MVVCVDAFDSVNIRNWEVSFLVISSRSTGRKPRLSRGLQGERIPGKPRASRCAGELYR